MLSLLQAELQRVFEAIDRQATVREMLRWDNGADYVRGVFRRMDDDLFVEEEGATSVEVEFDGVIDWMMEEVGDEAV